MDALSHKLSLNHLSEEECEAILKVIQRDFELRQSEKARLGAIEEEVEKEETKAVILSKEQNFNENCCMRCFSKFFFIFNAKVTCKLCKYNVCKNCSSFNKEENDYVCGVCSKQNDVSKKACEWFYNDVRSRFKRFGSAKVVRSLHKRKTESEESDYAQSDSAMHTSHMGPRNRRGRITNGMATVFSMDLDENSVNNLGRQAAAAAAEAAGQMRDSNHNTTPGTLQPQALHKPYTCTTTLPPSDRIAMRGMSTYEAVRDRELLDFDVKFASISGDIRRVLKQTSARQPTRSYTIVTRHEYEKAVDNHRLHLQSSLTSLAQSLHIAMDNESSGDIRMTSQLPNTSSEKHSLVRQTIHKRVEQLCTSTLDLEDERTSEYGSDNSGAPDFSSGGGGGNDPWEELLSHAVIKLLVTRHIEEERLAREADERVRVSETVSDMSEDSSDTPRLENDNSRHATTSETRATERNKNELPKLNLPQDSDDDDGDFDLLVEINSLATQNRSQSHKQSHPQQLHPSQSQSTKQQKGSQQSKTHDSKHGKSGHDITDLNAVKGAGRKGESWDVGAESEEKGGGEDGDVVLVRQTPINASQTVTNSQRTPGKDTTERPHPVPSPRLRHSTPLRPEPVPEMNKIISSPEKEVNEPSPIAPFRTATSESKATGAVQTDAVVEEEITEEELSQRLSALTSNHEVPLPSFGIEPEAEQTEVVLDPAADGFTGSKKPVVVRPSEGNVTFGPSFASKKGILNLRSFISAYDNIGYKKVGKTGEQPQVMLVPRGEVEEITVPKVGDQNADELSDLSENEAGSDVPDDESESSNEYDVTQGDIEEEDDMGVDEEEAEDEEESEEEDSDEETGGFYDREGHFVVSDRLRAASVGSNVYRTYIPASEQLRKNAAEKQSRQNGTHHPRPTTSAVQTDPLPPLNIQTFQPDRMSSKASTTSSTSYLDDINIPPPSPEIPDTDPVFVVKPEKIVTVMEGECAKFQVQVAGTAPIDVFWYRELAGVIDLAEEQRCDIDQLADNKYTCTLYNTTRQDQGRYLCIAINELGQCSRYFNLKVIDYLGETTPAEFVKPLSDLEIIEGEELKLRCKIKGAPTPLVRWYRDGKPLRNTNKLVIEKFGKRDHVLSIADVSTSDEAEYSVVCSNSAGTAKCSALVTVLHKHHHDASALQRSRASAASKTSDVYYPDTDSLLRLAQQLQSSNSNTQQQAEDMMSAAKRMAALRQALDEADSSLYRSESALVTMDTNNNDAPTAWDSEHLRQDAVKVREATGSALRLLSALDSSSASGAAKGSEPDSPRSKAEEEIELDFSYEQYDLLYRAGLITHEQIRKGSVPRKTYTAIEQFLREEQETIQQLTKKFSSGSGNDVIVTSDLPEVLDCGLKRVDSKRYGKDFVINRSTPQVKRRVWTVQTACADGTEVVKATPAGEKEVVASEELHTREDSPLTFDLASSLLDMPATWRQYWEVVRELQRRALNTAEEDVYLTAGRAFNVEESLRNMESRIDRLNEHSSPEQIARMRDDVVTMAAEVARTEQEVGDIESRVRDIKSDKHLLDSIQEQSSVPEQIKTSTAPANHTGVNSQSDFRGNQNQSSQPIEKHLPEVHVTTSEIVSQEPSYQSTEEDFAYAKRPSGTQDTYDVGYSDKEFGADKQEVTTEGDLEGAEEMKLPSVQNLRSMFAHEFPTTDETGAKRVYSLTGRDIPRTLREKLRLGKDPKTAHPHVATLFTATQQRDQQTHTGAEDRIQRDDELTPHELSYNVSTDGTTENLSPRSANSLREARANVSPASVSKQSKSSISADKQAAIDRRALPDMYITGDKYTVLYSSLEPEETARWQQQSGSSARYEYEEKSNQTGQSALSNKQATSQAMPGLDVSNTQMASSTTGQNLTSKQSAKLSAQNSPRQAHSPRSSMTSPLTSPGVEDNALSPRGRSSAILARAAFWDQRIMTGQTEDSKVIDQFPEIPQESFKKDEDVLL